MTFEAIGKCPMDVIGLLHREADTMKAQDCYLLPYSVKFDSDELSGEWMAKGEFEHVPHTACNTRSH